MKLVYFKDLLEDDSEPQYGILADTDKPEIVCLCCGGLVEFGDYAVIKEEESWLDISTLIKNNRGQIIMKTERSNYQSCMMIQEYWNKTPDIKPGFISGQQKKYIEETLELETRDRLSLQNLRDFAVIYFTSLSKDHAHILHDKMWDCMSAVSSTIDSYMMVNSKAIGTASKNDRRIKDDFGLMFGDECSAIANKYKDGSNEPLDGDEVDRLVEHLRNTLNLQEGNIVYSEYEELESGECKTIKSYSYSFEDGTDDEYQPCKIMTIYIHFEDGTQKSIADITMGIDCESDTDYIAEVCEDTLENYGYKILNHDLKSGDEGE